MYSTLAPFYDFKFWILIFPLIGLGVYLALCSRSQEALFERLALLFGRLVLYFGSFCVTLIFYTSARQHYHVVKAICFEFVILLMLASWWALKGRWVRPRTPLLVPAAFLFLIESVMAFFSVNMGEGWTALVLYGAALMQVVLIGVFLPRVADLKLFCIVLNITTLLVVLYALGQWFDWQPIWSAIEGPNNQRFTEKPVSFLGNENYAAEFINMTFPVAISLLIYSWGNPFWMAMYSTIVCLTLIAFLYIDCNASYMGFAVGFPVMALILISYRGLPILHYLNFINPKSGQPFTLPELRLWFRRGTFALILALSILAAVLASVENPLRTRVAELITWADVDGDYKPDGVPPMIFRLECMRSTIVKTYDNVLIGIGPGNFKVIHPGYETQLERKLLGKETLAREAHSDFLQHSAEFGIFGLFAYFWLWVTALWCGFRSLRILDWGRTEMIPVGPKDRPLSFDDRRFLFYFQVGAITAMIIALVSCNFGHTFVWPASVVLFYFLAGAAGLVYSWIRGEELTRQKKVNVSGFHYSAIPTYLRWPVLLVGVLLFTPTLVRQIPGECHLRLGMSYQKLNRYAETFDHFNQSMRVWPYEMETFYILGRFCIDAFQEIELTRKAYEDKAKEYMGETELTAEQKTVVNAEVDRLTREHLARYGLSENDKSAIVDRGIKCLQVDVFLNPFYKWAHNNLGVLYDKKAAFEFSKRAYNRVLEIDYEQVYAHYNRGLWQVREQQYDRAQKSFEAAYISDPENTEVLQYLGYSYYQSGNYESAKDALDHYIYKKWDEKGLTWTPDPDLKDSLVAWYTNIGSQLGGAGRFEKAADALVRAISFGIEDLEVDKWRAIQEQLALNYFQLRKYDDALRVFEQMVARHDKDNTTRRHISQILSIQGKYEESLVAMRRVTQDEPYDWLAWYNCANLKLAIGKYDNASILSDLKVAFEKDAEATRTQLIADRLLVNRLQGDPALKEFGLEDLFIQIGK
ncbi:MAG TPA: tetratricopeptide repeat protein [bacterium]|nr:tetratricopeptide repeat protein [bacterium]HQP98441.1 tetratricopeptide repeat protein [bacterium]